MTRHANIPVFIPHLGCPNQCVFCNQRSITGVSEFDYGSIRAVIDTALETIEPDAEVEIAFFGGSFTGIDYSLMCDLLEIAYSYVLSGRVQSIRCSTRPDYISKHILDALKRYGVKTIELGLQSSSDDVLALTKRGHTYQNEVEACRMIVDNGFDLVGQMMIGLPGSTPDSEEETARFIVSMGATGARIYPTVVFKDTELCHMAEQRCYEPLSLDDAIVRSARALRIFKDAGVDVIRIGLCSSDNLSDEKTYFAGPNHPALGELVESEYYYGLIKEKITEMRIADASCVEICGAPRTLSKLIGQKKKNKFRLKLDFPTLGLRFTESESVSEYEVNVQIAERTEQRCI